MTPLSTRLTYAAIVLGMLLLAFTAYQTVAVPLVEGNNRPLPDVLQPQQNFAKSTDRFHNLVSPLFPANSWEVQQAKILGNDQILLLVQDWEQLDQHHLHLSPCTIVFRPDGLHTPNARTWILKAPDGATLQMDEGADIRRGSLGQIVSAYIQGQVTLHSNASRPGADDAVHLTTTHLQISERKIWTPQNVEFSWGPNRGRGRDLTIHLLPSKDLADDAVLPAQLRSIELVHTDELLVMVPGKGNPPTSTPVSVHCDGPLMIDMMGGMARLQENVSIQRALADGQQDRLQCQEITVRFAQDRHQTGSALEIERVFTTGEPAVFTSRRAASQEYRFAAPRMEYDLGDQVFAATGPGRFTMRADTASAQGDDANLQWQGHVSWKPGNGEGQLIIDGGVSGRAGNKQISADEFRAWLPIVNTPSQPNQLGTGEIYPRRVTATGNVQVRTPQLEGATHKLDLVIQPTATTGSGLAAPTTGMALRAPLNSPSTKTKSAGNYFRVFGSDMRIQVDRTATGLELRDVTLDGDVRCLASGKSSSQGQPVESQQVELMGRSLLLRGISATTGVATIKGRPAKIRARGMDISGPTINLDRTQNRIWIDGAGAATLPLPEAIAKRHPGAARFANVVWENGMTFDGKTIVCNNNVDLRGPAQTIRARELMVNLAQAVDLSAEHLDNQNIQLESVVAQGQVQLEHRQVGPRGLESIDSASVQRLTLKYGRDLLVGEGPGWLETVRLGKGGLGPLNAPAPTGSSLMYLRVDFREQVQAMPRKREANFGGGIAAIFGPVANWDQRLPVQTKPLGPGQLYMQSNTLRVFQVRQGRPGVTPVEFEAAGNTLVESDKFAAQADRMSFDQGKGQLLIQGDNRAMAKLWRRSAPTAKPQELVAQRIGFWPATNTVKVDGVQSLNFSVGARTANQR